MGFFRGPSFTRRSDKIEGLQSTVCDFGTPVPLLYGTCKVSPNLICYQDFTTKERRVTQKSGKHSKSTTITYLYYVYAELALGEGVVGAITKAWVGSNAYGSLSALNSNANNTGAGLALNTGSNEGPTTYMATNHPEIATGYGKLAYVYGKIFLGEDTASMPSYSFEVKGTLLADGNDANPADVISDILTRIGLGSYIDGESWKDYRLYCLEADLLISTPEDAFDSQKKAQEIIATVLELTNTYMFWSVDRFKFVPRDDIARGGWQPDKTIIYDLDADELLEQSNGAPVVFKRKDSSELYNYVTVNFTNRANDYESESVSYQDVASIKAYGIRSKTYNGKWYHTKERALKYAQIKTRLAQTECNQYTLKLPWKYCRLEPGDLVRITDKAIGISGQVAMVSEVSEAKDGLITVTALQRAPGDYGEAKYKVDNKYQYQDFNVEPGSTARPLFIIPPSDLVASSSGCELWIALHGDSEDWGGCDVYVSTKDGDYSYNGTHGVSSVYGQLVSDLYYDGDIVDIELDNPRAVELLTGSAQDAKDGNTLIWINGECMSYSLATLQGSNVYTLSGLVRGQYGTKQGEHYYDDDVAILDGNIYAVSLPKSYIGKTLYFKFPAFNAFKANGQDLADVDCYTCVVGVGDLPNCTNIMAYNKYRDVDGVIVYHDIIVEWQPPAGLENYQQAQVWYKASTESKWQYGGQGYNKATLPQVDIGVTYDIAVCTQDVFGNVETPDSSAQTSILVALSTEIPNTPENISISIGDYFTVKWDEVRNADIKYYEVRLDNQAGVDNSNFIARVSDASCTTNAVQERKGSVYVFAVSAYGKISAPAKADYSFEAPKVPEIIVDARFQGLECHVNSIPANCIGVHWYISGTQYVYDEKTSNLSLFKSLSAGVYDVKACYYDYFGNGPFSGQIMSSVKATIDNSLLAAEAISTDKLDAATKKALEDAKEAAKLNGNVYTKTETDNQISNTMANFKNGELKSYATITQMNDAISLAVKDVDVDGNTVLTKINLADGTILLDGKYIHITGNTKVDGSIITNDMLAGGITADKIMVNSLSAICATIGMLRTATSGARTEIKDNLIEVYDSNNVLRVKMGVW